MFERRLAGLDVGRQACNVMSTS